jgi:HAE1 family hydrophobic/amphiphilic exporter-1
VLFPGAGSELYRGLGSVLLGGLLVSTLVTIVLVPLLLGLCFRVFETVQAPAAEAAPLPSREVAPVVTVGA